MDEELKSRVVSGFVGMVLGVGLCLLLGDKLAANPSASSLELTAGAGGPSLKLESSGGQVDYELILERLFASDFFADGALGWLEKHQQVFRLFDPDLANAIGSQLCAEFPEAPLQENLAARNACAEVEVAAKLRLLSDGRRAPFHYVGQLGTVGVPAKAADRPRQGHANVCAEGGYLGKKIEVIDPVSQRSVKVQATGFYECPDLRRYPIVQLAKGDAVALFDRPLRQHEQVLVVPLG